MDKPLLINYSSRNYKKAQGINAETGCSVGGFQECIKYNEQDISDRFREENSSILNEPRGAGYWLWKPYIISKTLFECPEDSFVFYCDSGAHFVGSVDQSLKLLSSLDQPFLIYEHSGGQTENKWTKGDAIDLLEYKDFDLSARQVVASYMLIRNCPEARAFIWTWLTACSDRRILTDDPSSYPNPVGFIEHRHDQAVLSILTHKQGYLTFKDPCQWVGTPDLVRPEVWERSKYDTWIQNDRNSA